jgi:hypothetical protein
MVIIIDCWHPADALTELLAHSAIPSCSLTHVLNHGHPCNQHHTTTTWVIGGGATATCYYYNNNNNNNNNKLTVPHRTHTVLTHSPTVPWSALVGLPWSASRTLIWTPGKQSFAGRVRAVTSGPPQCIFVPNATAGAACAWFCSATALLHGLRPPATTCNHLQLGLAPGIRVRTAFALRRRAAH